jgi:hypothetical protein
MARACVAQLVAHATIAKDGWWKEEDVQMLTCGTEVIVTVAPERMVDSVEFPISPKICTELRKMRFLG